VQNGVAVLLGRRRFCGSGRKCRRPADLPKLGDAEIIIGETLDTTTVTATVDLASIDTANADRGKTVLSPALFDVA
jgi:hypothetical protein